MPAHFISPAPHPECPCAPPCAHIDCRWMLEAVAARCGVCLRPIGYATTFYTLAGDTDGEVHGYVHVVCVTPRAELERAADAAVSLLRETAESP